MNRTTTSLAFAVLSLFATVGIAHEKSEHKGKPVEGEVTAVSADRVTVRTEEGTVSVVLDEKTTLERGDRPAAKTDLKQGEHIAVFGTKLSAHEVMAREIVIGGAHATKPGTEGRHDMPAGHHE